jgi:hypothetical protein
MVYRALCRVLRRGGDGGVCWKWRKHTSSTCVWKASISSQRLRMRSSSLGKSIDIVAGVGEEDRHGRGEYFVPCIGPRLTQAVRGARRGAAFAPSVPLTYHYHRPRHRLHLVVFNTCVKRSNYHCHCSRRRLLVLLFHHALVGRIAICDKALAAATLIRRTCTQSSRPAALAIVGSCSEHPYAQATLCDTVAVLTSSNRNVGGHAT